MRTDLVRSVALSLLAAVCLVAARPASAQITVTLPDVSCVPGDVVNVPITASPSPLGQGILSIDFRLSLNPAVVFGSVSEPDGFLQGWGSAFSNGTSTFLAAAAAGTTPLTSTGTLVNTVQLRLQPHAVIGTIMPLTFQHFLFNEGTPSVTVVPGAVHVIAPSAGVPAPGPGAFGLALASPDPARGSAVFVCTGIGGVTARLAVYAIDGRLVREEAVGGAAGGATFRWDLRDRDGTAVRPGLYLARLVAGGRARQLRVVVLD